MANAAKIRLPWPPLAGPNVRKDCPMYREFKAHYAGVVAAMPKKYDLTQAACRFCGKLEVRPPPVPGS